MYNFYDFMGYPSLFRDGKDIWSNYSPDDWRDSVEARMALPSPITLTFTGIFYPYTDSGMVHATFRNDSSAAITARVYFVITEDSLYHVDPPAGHAWHNRLAHAFVPDEIGEQVTINPGDSVTIDRVFILDPSWDENRSYITTWIQADPPSRDGYQSGEIKLTDIFGIEENVGKDIHNHRVALVANPCRADNVKFSITVPSNTSYRIEIYDILGRSVKAITGVTTHTTEQVSCNLNQGTTKVSSGVYLYRFTSNALTTTGKIIIR